MRNSDHSCGDTTFDMKDKCRSTGRTSRIRGERIQVMLKSYHSMVEGMAIDFYVNRIKVIAKTNRRVDDTAVACVRHCNFRVISNSWL